MAQINLHVTQEFEEALELLMRGRRLRSKSEAIRHAVQEAAAPYRTAPARDFSLLQGLIGRHGTGERDGKRRPMAELEREIDDGMERALGAGETVLGTGENAVGAGKSAVGTGGSAVDTGESAVGARKRAPGARRKAPPGRTE